MAPDPPLLSAAEMEYGRDFTGNTGDDDMGTFAYTVRDTLQSK